tara:strand:+ start:8550 stop:8909 length:360 start_codon:yes stop_codon:yes gene_type:complete
METKQTTETTKTDAISHLEPEQLPPNSVALDTPIKRGGQAITRVTLRKPNAGELRGLSLTEILQLDVSSLQRLLPRISDPVLTEHDVAQLDPADLVQLGGVAVGFLLPKAKPEQAYLIA